MSAEKPNFNQSEAPVESKEDFETKSLSIEQIKEQLNPFIGSKDKYAILLLEKDGNTTVVAAQIKAIKDTVGVSGLQIEFEDVNKKVAEAYIEMRAEQSGDKEKGIESSKDSYGQLPVYSGPQRELVIGKYSYSILNIQEAPSLPSKSEEPKV